MHGIVQKLAYTIVNLRDKLGIVLGVQLDKGAAVTFFFQNFLGILVYGLLLHKKSKNNPYARYV